MRIGQLSLHHARRWLLLILLAQIMLRCLRLLLLEIVSGRRLNRYVRRWDSTLLRGWVVDWVVLRLWRSARCILGLVPHRLLRMWLVHKRRLLVLVGRRGHSLTRAVVVVCLLLLLLCWVIWVAIVVVVVAVECDWRRWSLAWLRGWLALVVLLIGAWPVLTEVRWRKRLLLLVQAALVVDIWVTILLWITYENSM